ncbi:hypothetical protein [Pedobacter namyangjuensis]|uniref:hypothetical protein n=1 Tax=Pedobacter namyangjuensis TaxID=600626 RepID=UPI000DE2E32F|nr:hypothetical protein [Pedobacter namyangjuensis]
MPSYECILFLDSELLSIIELKFISVGGSTGTYANRWFSINKATNELCPLALRSIDSSHEIRECYFDQGFLKYSSTSGTYIEKFNSGQHSLEHRKANLSPETAMIIDNHILQLPQAV